VHALAAEVRNREYGQTVSKMKSRAHTDALMAALYAVAELAAMKEKRTSVYEARGLVSAYTRVLQGVKTAPLGCPALRGIRRPALAALGRIVAPGRVLSLLAFRAVTWRGLPRNHARPAREASSQRGGRETRTPPETARSGWFDPPRGLRVERQSTAVRIAGS
jgi:hypothetical protein